MLGAQSVGSEEEDYAGPWAKLKFNYTPNEALVSGLQPSSQGGKD